MTACAIRCHIFVCVRCSKMHSQNGFTWIESIVMPEKQDYSYKVHNAHTTTTTWMTLHYVQCDTFLLFISFYWSSRIYFHFQMTVLHQTICHTLKIHLFRYIFRFGQISLYPILKFYNSVESSRERDREREQKKFRIITFSPILIWVNYKYMHIVVISSDVLFHNL